MIFMSENSRKSTTLVLILLGLGVLVFLLAAREGRDRPISIATTHAVRQNLISAITPNGKVEPVEPRIIQAQLTTFIEGVVVKEGQRVDGGQLLMTFLHDNAFNKGCELGLDDTRFNRLDLPVGRNCRDQILAHCMCRSDRYGSIPSFARREQEDQHAKTQQN